MIKSFTATSNKENWKVTITSDTKDLTLENTQEIKLKVEDNEKVAKGKMVSGMKAIAEIELDLTGTEMPIDFVATIDETNTYHFYLEMQKH